MDAEAGKINVDTMDPVARKDYISKRIVTLLNMLVKEGLRPSHQLELNKELEEYMDMDDGDYTLNQTPQVPLLGRRVHVLPLPQIDTRIFPSGTVTPKIPTLGGEVHIHVYN